MSSDNNPANQLFNRNLNNYIHSLIVVIGCLTWLYGILGIMRGEYLLGGVDLFIGMLLTGLFLFRKKLSQGSKSVFLTTATLIYMLFLIYDGATGNVGYLWMMVYPSVAFYMLGIKRGNIWVGLGFVFLIILSILNFLGILELPYEEIVIIQFNVVYGVISFLTFLAEKDRQERNKEMKKISERLKFIIRNSKITAFVLDKEGNYIFLEGMDLKKINLNPTQLVSTSALEKYKDFPEVVNGIKQCLRGVKTSFKSELGEDIYQFELSPIVSKNGGVDGVMGLLINVTEEQKNRREIDRKLKEMEKMNKLMVGREVKMAEMKEELLKLKGEEVFDNKLEN